MLEKAPKYGERLGGDIWEALDRGGGLPEGSDWQACWQGAL